MTAPHTLPAVNFFDPAFKAGPFPAYAALRGGTPIHPVPLPNGETVWLVTRYADVLTVLRDPRFAKDLFAALTPEQLARQPRAQAGFRLLHRHLLSLDPPDHTRLRALVQAAFTPRYIETLRPRVQQVADELLSALPEGSEVDLIAAYAFPLPLTVIAEMVGVPAADRDLFRAWSAAVVSNPAPGPGTSGEVLRVLAEFGDYLRAHLARLRRQPDERPAARAAGRGPPG
ncbi:cytochrome P450 [Deinococcus apachensis]|uniref:cytochrome P450 n=1 Tax=Deinococcus apachensis TaxID=309886 RepID=UPI00039AB51E|nr:cytochrome P450 [Deinococcus apachensis]